MITQPTLVTTKPPETNSTLELKVLTKNLEKMLKPKSSSHKKILSTATPEKQAKASNKLVKDRKMNSQKFVKGLEFQ